MSNGTSVPGVTSLVFTTLNAGSTPLSIQPQETIADQWNFGVKGNTNIIAGSTHSSTTVDSLASNVLLSNWQVGATITDAYGDIPPNTTIAAIASNGLSLSLSQAATGSHTGNAFTVSSARLNQVFQFGWNVGPNEQPIVASDGMAVMSMESFWNNNIGNPQMEWHFIFQMPNGGQNTRWISTSMDMVTGTLGTTVEDDTFTFSDKLGNVRGVVSSTGLSWQSGATFTQGLTITSGNLSFAGGAISGSPTWAGSPTYTGNLAIQGTDVNSINGSTTFTGVPFQHAVTVVQGGNDDGLFITGSGTSFVNPRLQLTAASGTVAVMRLAGGGDSALQIGGTSDSGSTAVTDVYIGPDVAGPATQPYIHVSGTLTAFQGNLQLAEATAPTSNPPTGSYYLYVDPADNNLKARGANGTITVLATP